MQTSGQTSEIGSCRIAFPGYIEELGWFINDAPRELGMRSKGIDYLSDEQATGILGDVGFGGRSAMSDTSRFHDRMISAMPATKKWRRIRAAWARLSVETQNVLTAAYTERGYGHIPGATLVFDSGLVGVALVVTTDYDALVGALKNSTKREHVPIITETRRLVVKALREAHAAYRDASRSSNREALEADA